MYKRFGSEVEVVSAPRRRSADNPFGKGFDWGGFTCDGVFRKEGDSMLLPLSKCGRHFSLGRGLNNVAVMD